ncbi:MAG: PAS domain-containing protein [Verrucomicrobiota bacterium]
MTWMTIAWPLAIGACVTMGLIQLRVGLRRTPGAANLLFALNAFVVAVYAVCEMALACADSPAEYLAWLRWLDIMAALQVVTIAAFVWVFFGTGRKWLAFLGPGLSCAALIADFMPQPKLVYLQLTGIKRIPTFGGATYTDADGVTNPWNAVFYAGVFLLLVFVVDASVTLWRRGAHRRAAAIGGTITFFVLVGGAQAALVDEEILQTPYLLSFAYLAILVAMGLELSHDVLNAGQLASDLRESEQRMTLATDAANLGIWIRDLVRNEIWATDKWRTLFGFAPSERIDLDGYLQKLHPADRDTVSRTMAKAVERGGHYETEYRVLRPDGQIRWIASRGRVEFNSAKQAVLVRGTSLDITERKLAEEAAQKLSGLLIHAQEAERTRLARELHDDLSQSLALLAVGLDMLGQQPPASSVVSERMQEFSAQVRNLSSGVHRLSHELHPAKLEQLGLVAAARGFAKELGAAHQIPVECEFHDVPRGLPDDIALCLYRIVQEGLQNVVKHSGATVAQVALRGDEKELRLEISDQGSGFDLAATTGNSSLGLVSMRERVRLVHGKISIHSSKGEGTRIEVRVPLPAEQPTA